MFYKFYIPKDSFVNEMCKISLLDFPYVLSDFQLL